VITIENLHVVFESDQSGDRAVFTRMFDEHMRRDRQAHTDERERDRQARADRSITGRSTW